MVYKVCRKLLNSVSLTTKNKMTSIDIQASFMHSQTKSFGLFGSSSVSSLFNLNPEMALLNDMIELKYIEFRNNENDGDSGFQFTNSGIAFLNRNLSTITSLITKHNMKLSNLGQMAGFMSGICNELNKRSDDEFLNLNQEYSIAQCDQKVNEVGIRELDMNTVRFTKKADGDIEC